MNSRTHTLAIALCATLTIGQFVRAQAPVAPPATTGTTNQITVPFSDPSRPGTVKVSVFSGAVSVKVGQGRDVIVTTTDGGRERDPDRDRDRDRRASGRGSGNGAGTGTGAGTGGGSGTGVSADGRTAGLRRLTQPAGVNIEQENNVISIASPVLMGAVNIAIQVPAATSLVLRSVNGGEVSVDSVTGSIEVNSVNGSILLTNVGGPVIAHATNGKVVATLRQIVAGKPMSFTSFNGDVDVTLPGTAKANLKMRSDRGDVYTDFDVQTTQAPARAQTPDASRDDRGNRGRDNRGNRDDPKDKAKYRLELDRSIYGMVNGGGPDFELRTFNGDVFLRKAK